MIEKLGRKRLESEMASIYRAHLGEVPMTLDYDAIAFTLLRCG
jgi:hypothetical protein